MSLIVVNDQNFESEVLKNENPVLVAFWGLLSSTSSELISTLEHMTDHRDGLIVAKLNVEYDLQTANKYGINAIPTMIIFKDGKSIATKEGAISKSEIEHWIDGVLP